MSPVSTLFHTVVTVSIALKSAVRLKSMCASINPSAKERHGCHSKNSDVFSFTPQEGVELKNFENKLLDRDNKEGWLNW